MANMLEVKHINKTYKGQVSYQALKQISFSIEEGEFTAVMGRPVRKNNAFEYHFND